MFYKGLFIKENEFPPNSNTFPYSFSWDTKCHSLSDLAASVCPDRKKISGRSLLIVNPHIDKPKREDQSHGCWNKSSLNFHLSESKMIWWTWTDRRAMHGNMKYFHYNSNDVFGLCCQTKVCLMKGCNSCPHLKHRLPYKLLILAGRENNFIVNSLTHWIARQNKTLKRSKRRTDRNNSLESIPKDMKWVTLKCQKEERYIQAFCHIHWNLLKMKHIRLFWKQKL